MVQINKSSSAKVQPLTCPGLSTRSASWAQLMKTIYSVAAATVVTQTLGRQCTRLRGVRGHHVHCRLVLPEKIWDAPKYCTGCTYVETSLAVYLKFWASCIFICKSGNLTPFTGDLRVYKLAPDHTVGGRSGTGAQDFWVQFSLSSASHSLSGKDGQQRICI